jgi:lysophospholipase L1-like esterase
MPATRGGSSLTAMLLTAALAVASLAAACGGGSAGTSGSRSASPLSRPAHAGEHKGEPAAARSTEPPPTQTSCRSVAHFGDSTSDGLVSADYLPNPAQRINAQYTRVGATDQHYEIEGATSVVETIEGQPNAYQLAQQLVQQGYRGCWVMALGTNDTADLAVGSNVGLAQRISRMMSVAAGEPVLWVNVKSLVTSGPYAETNMQEWNSALLQACRSYPNMRVFDWASVAQPGWFISDGIHYTSAGYAERAKLIANALVQAFPRGQPASARCVVP